MNKLKFKIAAILFLATIGLVFRLAFFSDAIPLYINLIGFCGSIVVISFFWFLLERLNAYLNIKLPYSKGILKRIFVQLTICQVFLYSFITFLMVVVVPRTHQVHVDKHMVITTYAIFMLINITANAAFIGSHFFTEWTKSIVREERLWKEKSIASFENLKNQLNPHFLFNSLSSLNSLIYENPELASRFLKQLSRVYRYLLENNETDLVTVDTEINFVQNYISLLKTRFGDGLEVTITGNEHFAKDKLVPVTLQILIENAIKHNITQDTQPLQIKVYRDDNQLVVENNIQRKGTVETSNKKGLQNLKNLYHYLIEKDLTIEETEGKFYVKIPLI